MAILTAIVLFHEYFAQSFIPYYKIKAEAFEAANSFVESFWENMAQEEINRSGVLSLQRTPGASSIKCKVNAFCSIKVELKDGQIFLIIQDGNSKIRMKKATFDRLYEYRESISFLISFLEGNSSVQQDGSCLVNSMG